MNVLRFGGALLLAPLLLAGCFSMMVDDHALQERRGLADQYRGALAWSPFQGTHRIDGRTTCTGTETPPRGLKSQPHRSVWRLELGPSPLYLVVDRDLATLQDQALPVPCSQPRGDSVPVVLLVSTDSALSFRPSTTDTRITALLRFQIDSGRPWPGKPPRQWALAAGSPLLLERDGKIVSLPVLVETSPDLSSVEKALANRDRLWYLLAVPADIATSPLQLLALPFVLYVAVASHCCR